MRVSSPIRRSRPGFTLRELAFAWLAFFCLCGVAWLLAVEEHRGELDRAAMAGDTASLRLALAAGNGALASRASVESALYCAAWRGRIDCMRMLLARLDARPGQPALVAAVMADQPEAVYLLLQAGADPRSADNRGKTPLTYAREYGRAAIAELLMRHGAR